MKRIIEGTTYNTDTATTVAEGSYQNEARGIVVDTTLYQARSGVFFAVDIIETNWYDEHRRAWRTRKSTEWEVIGDAAKAAELCEKAQLTILRDFGELPPEADDAEDEPATTVYMRAPPALKAALERRAKEEKVSLNVLMLRCAEECLKRRAPP
jgi:hypothetical protein